MTLQELFNSFTSQEIADVLYSLGLTTTGSKAERIQRLITEGSSPTELLESFSAEALRGVCDNLRLPTGRRKAEMVERLCALLDNSLQTPTVETKPSIRPATKDDTLSVLRNMRVPRRKAREEYDAQGEIQSVLSSHFEDVAFEYNVGGYFGSRIDLDIGNGKVGVEVKLANALFEAAGAHRLIGQAVYYQRRRYRDNLIVAVVGTEEDLRDPRLRETRSFLADLGISCVAMPTI